MTLKKTLGRFPESHYSTRTRSVRGYGIKVYDSFSRNTKPEISLPLILPDLSDVWIFNRASSLLGAAGTSISSWACTQETGRSWVQVTESQDPLITGSGNSKAVAFDGIDDVLVSNENWSPGSVLHVFFVLELPVSDMPTGACLMRSSSTSVALAKIFGIRNNSNSVPPDRFSFNQHVSTTRWVTAKDPQILNELILLEFIVRDADALVLVNGEAGTPRNLSLSDSSQQWRLAASGPTGSSAINANIRDVLICTSIQSNASDIRNYFMQFHGIS